MKKLLLALITFGTLSMSAQQLISFEASEGYTTGDINGQNGWTVTGTGGVPPAPAFITGQVVSNTLATDGVNSFKVADEPLFGPQTAGPVIGGFYTLPTAASSTNFTVSFDTRITEDDGSDWVYRGVNVGTTSAIVYYFNFSYDGTVNAATVAPGATGPSLAATGATWLPNVWYRVKIVGTPAGIEYYINNALVYTGTALLPAPGNLNRIDFIHDNYGGDNYIDRIAINNESALSTQDVIKSENIISVYPNPTADFLNIKTEGKVKSILVYDMAGRAMDVKVSDKKVDVRALQTGAYIINVETSAGKTTEKFIKK